MLRENCRDKIKANYNRDLYYIQYLDRAKKILKDIYEALQRLHLDYFKKEYPVSAAKRHSGKKDADVIVDQLFEGVNATMCHLVHKHMKNRYNDKKKNKKNIKHRFGSIINDDVWAMCESGKGINQCPWFRKENGL